MVLENGFHSGPVTCAETFDQSTLPYLSRVVPVKIDFITTVSTAYAELYA